MYTRVCTTLYIPTPEVSQVCTTLYIHHPEVYLVIHHPGMYTLRYTGLYTTRVCTTVAPWVYHLGVYHCYTLGIPP